MSQPFGTSVGEVFICFLLLWLESRKDLEDVIIEKSKKKQKQKTPNQTNRKAVYREHFYWYMIMFIQVCWMDVRAVCVCLSLLWQGCISRSINQSSRTPAMTESESTDETVLAGTGMTSSPGFWEVLAATTLLFWPLLNTYNSLRAWQVDRDVHCPLARQWGSARAPGELWCGSFQNPSGSIIHCPLLATEVGRPNTLLQAKPSRCPGLCCFQDWAPHSVKHCAEFSWAILGCFSLWWAMKWKKIWRCQARSCWCRA